MTPCYLQRGGSGRILGTKGLFGCVLVEGSVHFTLLWLGSESLVDSGGGGSRFSIAAPGYNGFRLSQNLANGPIGFAGCCFYKEVSMEWL